MTEHTKLPWRLEKLNALAVRGPKNAAVAFARVVWSSAPGETTTRETAEANAAFIVKAVNAYDELVDILGRAREWVELGPELPGLAVTDEHEARGLLAEIDAALAKAQQP